MNHYLTNKKSCFMRYFNSCGGIPPIQRLKSLPCGLISLLGAPCLMTEVLGYGLVRSPAAAITGAQIRTNGISLKFMQQRRPTGKILQDLWTCCTLITTDIINGAAELISKHLRNVLPKLSERAGRGSHLSQLIQSANKLAAPDIDKLWEPLYQCISIFSVANPNTAVAMFVFASQTKGSRECVLTHHTDG